MNTDYNNGYVFPILGYCFVFVYTLTTLFQDE